MLLFRNVNYWFLTLSRYLESTQRLRQGSDGTAVRGISDSQKHTMDSVLLYIHTFHQHFGHTLTPTTDAKSWCQLFIKPHIVWFHHRMPVLHTMARKTVRNIEFIDQAKWLRKVLNGFFYILKRDHREVSRQRWWIGRETAKWQEFKEVQNMHPAIKTTHHLRTLVVCNAWHHDALFTNNSLLHC